MLSDTGSRLISWIFSYQFEQAYLGKFVVLHVGEAIHDHVANHPDAEEQFTKPGYAIIRKRHPCFRSLTVRQAVIPDTMRIPETKLSLSISNVLN